MTKDESVKAGITLIREARRMAEVAIENAIQREIDVIKKVTGLGVEHVGVSMMDITVMGDKEPQYRVGSVNVDIKL